uniref:Uncharacterized protein n=1 Tax=Oryza rufipogon TaxID=4529 RepID=A0A0E0QES8_ORYRU
MATTAPRATTSTADAQRFPPFTSRRSATGLRRRPITAITPHRHRCPTRDRQPRWLDAQRFPNNLDATLAAQRSSAAIWTGTMNSV